MAAELFGWIKDDQAVAEVLAELDKPLVADHMDAIRGTGQGKVVLLYEAVRKVTGRDHDPGPQEIGDCVGWGFAGCVDILACIEILQGENEHFDWEHRTSTEFVYAMSRVDYGKLGGSYSDGSVGAWAAKAVNRGGVVPRKVVGEYSGKRAREWGAKGAPLELKNLATSHKIRTVSLVKTYEEARDLIANGYPIAVCSGVGFNRVRDEKGFLKRKGSWAHCMKFIAVNDNSSRPGLLCANSWGSDWPAGPKGEFDIPPNAFWVDAETCDKMLAEGDSFALSAFDGYPAQKLDWLI